MNKLTDWLVESFVKDIDEDINIPVKVGDTILVGKFKNKKMVIKDIGKDDHGMPTINGRKATTFRIHKTVNIFDKEEVTEGVNDPGIFKAVFLAGGPGSGKSYVASQLFGIPEKVNISAYGLKLVNQDTELENFLKKYFGYVDIDKMPDELFKNLTDPKSKDYSGMRSRTKALSKKRLELYKKGRLGVIIDGTGHKFKDVKKQRKELMDLGYDTFMVYVNTSLEVAQKRNEERPRVLPAGVVEKYWHEVQKNMAVFQGMFGNANFLLVDNNQHLSPKQAQKKFNMLVSKGIGKFIKRPMKNKIAKMWVDKQKIVKESIGLVGGDGTICGAPNPKKVKKVKNKLDTERKDDEYRKVSENNKAQLMKLYTKAMKMMPGSPNQKKVKKQIDALRKKLKMNNESLPIKIKDKYKKLKDKPGGDAGKDFSQHHKNSMSADKMGRWAEPDTYDWDDDYKEKGGYQKEKDKKKKGYEPVLEIQKEIKKVVGIYAGRFQPFGPHHKKVYEWLKKQFDDAYITTSDIKKPPKHPMNFKEKKRHMTKMGIPSNKIVKEKQPYVAVNTLKKFDKDTTAVVYVFGAKDADRLKGGKYFQDYKKNKNNLVGHDKNGYILTAPHFSIQAGGMEVSGTAMRQLLGSPKYADDRERRFKKFFGYFDKGVYNMMTNKFSKLFGEDIVISKELIEDFLVDVDISNILKESTAQINAPVDDGPPTFYKGFGDYKRESEKWINSMFEETGWVVLNHVLSDKAHDPAFDYTLNYRFMPTPSYGTVGIKGRQSERSLHNKYKKRLNFVISNLGFEVIKWMGLEAGEVRVQPPVLPGADDETENTDLKESKLFTKDWWNKELLLESGEEYWTDMSADAQQDYISKHKTSKNVEPDNPSGKKPRDVKDSWTEDNYKEEYGEFDKNDYAKASMPGLFKNKEDGIQKMKNAENRTLTDKEILNIRNSEAGDILRLDPKKRKEDAQGVINYQNFEDGERWSWTGKGKAPSAEKDEWEEFQAGMESGDVKREKGWRDISRAMDGYEKGADIPQSIVVRDKEGNIQLLGGNTRLTGAIAVGKNPSVKVIDYDGKFKDKKESVDERINIDEEVKLLIEGGAYGHMNHPFDDKNLTFGDLKKIIELGLGGELDREDGVTEKLDGQNLMISWKDGKLVTARNKGQLKNFGANSMDVKGVASKFAGRGDIKDAFVFAMKDLGKSIGSLSDKQKEKVFGNGKMWMNLEVMWPKSANVIDYDKAQIVFHGTLEYDDSGNAIGQPKGSARMLAGMIKQVNQHIQKHYAIGKPQFLTVPKSQNFGSKKKTFMGRLNKLQKEFGLKNNDTLSMYHQSYWEEYIYNAAKQFKYKISKNVLYKLTRRWAFFDKSYSVRDMKSTIKNDKFLNWVLTTDKVDHQKMVKQNMRPFEVLFFAVGTEILKNIKGYLAVSPDKAVQKIRKDVISAINTVKKSKDIKKLETLKHQVGKLNSIGGLKSIVPSEGIVFKYKGNTYKFTGAFAPVNQIVGLLNF
jgi:predicted kinase